MQVPLMTFDVKVERSAIFTNMDGRNFSVSETKILRKVPTLVGRPC
jgi:hypothetical protein